MTLLFGASGTPEPSPEIQRRLRQVCPDLVLEWNHGLGCFQVKLPWRSGDRRWQLVQSNQMAEADAYDVMAFLPKDIRMEDVPGYLERGRMGTTREEVATMLLANYHHNLQQSDENARPAVERALDHIEANSKLIQVPKAYLSDVKAATPALPESPTVRRAKRKNPNPPKAAG